jgi:digeranylgeranylglycerophospholipid reductase
MKIFDAVIVGGSIAGLYAGMKLARGGMSVCIIDRKRTIGVPVRCGEATGNRAELSRFFEPRQSWIAREFHGCALHINRTHDFKQTIRDAGVVLHRDKLEQDLATSAEKFGATLFLDTAVTGLRANSKGAWDGVFTDTGNFIAGRFLVGADGCESKVGQWAGITGPLSLNEAASSIEYHVESDYCNDGFLHFFMGASVIRPGYIWVFPKGENRVLAGGCLFGCPQGAPKVKHYVDAFIKSRMPDAHPHSMITGCAPVTVCPRELTRKNVLIIGDAARQVNPLSAGGIMNALEAADLATHAMLTSGGDERRLGEYSRRWAGNQRRQQKVYRLLRDMAVDSSDDEISAMARTASRIFKGEIDRSKPFKLSIMQAAMLGLTMLPKAVRHVGALAG